MLKAAWAIGLWKLLEGVGHFEDGGLGAEVPVEHVELGGEGVGEDEVVVDELPVRTTGTVGDAPAHGLAGTGEDLEDAIDILEADLIGVDAVAEAAGLDDGEEAPADLGFLLLGELDGDDAGGKGAVEQGPEALADAGSIDDDVPGMPGLGEVLELSKDGEVALAEPAVTGDTRCWALEVGGWTVNFDGRRWSRDRDRWAAVVGMVEAGSSDHDVERRRWELAVEVY
jgi:hypothetical protein